MLLIVLALFWVALLAPIAVRRLREGGTEKSIVSFHAEHEVLSRQDYSVAPAHRLDRPDHSEQGVRVPERKPRLTVVHADDTFGSLESRSSWDDWADDYEYDDSAQPTSATNRYARAYSSQPAEPAIAVAYEAPLHRRSMRSQRRIIFSRTVLVAVVLTAVAFITGYPMLFDVAALALLAVVFYIALAFYAVSQGYLNDSSLPVRVPQRRPLATIEPLYAENHEDYARHYEDEFESEFYEPEADTQWSRQPQRRRALG